MIIDLLNLKERQWVILSFINFFIVALFGLFMRMKILFPIAWLNQKNIMHAHSHFAFSAWVSQLILLFMIKAVFNLTAEDRIPKRYSLLLLMNLLLSFGMLVTFSLGGYFVGSIVCSFLVVVVSYCYSFYLSRDIIRSELPLSIKRFFNAALFFNVFSSIGTYALVYLKVTKSVDPLKQLASIYFYLHFQYNGWFLMACLGLFTYWIYRRKQFVIMNNLLNTLFILLVFPTYLLSVLWWDDFPKWLFVVLVVAVLFQLFAWGNLFYTLFKRKVFAYKNVVPLVRCVTIFVLLALSIKIILQSLSIFPALSQLVYGYRSIVVAYLHLVLLGFISMFLLAFSLAGDFLHRGRLVQVGVYSLLGGVFLNELFLAIQGVGGLLNISFTRVNEGLFGAAIMMVLSIAFILIGQARRRESK